MKKIKILIIGKSKWLEQAKDALSSDEDNCYETEIIEDESLAVNRLSHNSYDILLIHDNFSILDSKKLAQLAYAMTRPTIITCSNFASYFHYTFWHYFSRFSNKFKTSKKLIYFNYKFNDINKHIKYLSNNYLQYFNAVKEEIRNNTL